MKSSNLYYFVSDGKAHRLICSTISPAQQQWQVMSHIPNISGKAREECVHGALKLRLEKHSAPGTVFTWHMGHAVCKEASLCASCRLPAIGGYPWNPMSRKCQGYACLIQKQVAESWLTIFLTILLSAYPGYSLQRSAEHLKGKKCTKFSDSEWVHRKEIIAFCERNLGLRSFNEDVSFSVNFKISLISTTVNWQKIKI